ncbi:hypothetical protein WA158_002017 [Blastocystis sp. Blastoise]
MVKKNPIQIEDITSDTIPQIFDICQKNSNKHKQNAELIMKYYVQNPEFFLDSFSDCMYRVVNSSGKDKDIYMIMKFIVLCCSQKLDSDDPTLPQLYSLVLEDLASYSGAKNKDIRYRCCRLIADILSTNIEIDDDLWDKLRYSMRSRLYDKVTSVRQASVSAMSFLQDPEDIDDMIITEMLKCAQTDTSKDVRKIATSSIVINSNTIPSLMNRIRDESIEVRVSLLLNITNHSLIRQFSIKQRRSILLCCYKDRSNEVQKACKNMVIYNWLKNDDIFTLLELLDCETDTEPGLIVLSILFETSIDIGTEPYIKANANISPDIKKLNFYESLYLRGKMMFYNTKNMDKEMEELIPDIPEYLLLLRLYESMDYIRTQLFEVLALLDLRDEICRRSVIQFVRQYIERKQGKEVDVDVLLSLYKKLVLPENVFITEVTEMISTIAEEVTREDIDVTTSLDIQVYILTVIKCLCKKCSPKYFYSQELLGLLTHYILPCVVSEETILRMESIHSLSLFCIMNKTIGLQHSSLIMCIALQDDESPLVQALALQALTDLLLIHGEQIQQGEDGVGIEEVVQCLVTYLDVPDPHLRTIAVTCFTKLFMCKRITNDDILSRLFLLLYNPVSQEDTLLIQTLSSFFPTYICNNKDILKNVVHASELALKVICQSPEDSPLFQVNLYTFGKYILYLLTSILPPSEPENDTPTVTTASSQSEDKPIDDASTPKAVNQNANTSYSYHIIDFMRTASSLCFDCNVQRLKELVKLIVTPSLDHFDETQLELYNNIIIDIYNGIQSVPNKKILSLRNKLILEINKDLESI